MQKRYKIGTFIPGIFFLGGGGGSPFQTLRKTLTNFITFIYDVSKHMFRTIEHTCSMFLNINSVMFSGDKLLAVCKPSPIQSLLYFQLALYSIKS